MGSYEGGGTPGGKWGSFAAALVGAPLFFLLIIVDSLGDCAPATDCHKGFLIYVALPTILVGLFVGVSVRAAVNCFKRNGG
jgi:hypothetical protein